MFREVVITTRLTEIFIKNRGADSVRSCRVGTDVMLHPDRGITIFSYYSSYILITGWHNTQPDEEHIICFKFVAKASDPEITSCAVEIVLFVFFPSPGL